MWSSALPGSSAVKPIALACFQCKETFFAVLPYPLNFYHQEMSVECDLVLRSSPSSQCIWSLLHVILCPQAYHWPRISWWMEGWLGHGLSLHDSIILKGKWERFKSQDGTECAILLRKLRKYVWKRRSGWLPGETWTQVWVKTFFQGRNSIRKGDEKLKNCIRIFTETKISRKMLKKKRTRIHACQNAYYMMGMCQTLKRRVSSGCRGL